MLTNYEKSSGDVDNKKKAFLLQFGGDLEEISEEKKLRFRDNPLYDIHRTGLFGILDTLIDLKLSPRQIEDFYVHGHVEPYNDPEEFIRGIVEIVWGMPEEEIKSEYGRYFDDETIKRISQPTKNTLMLMSFCYNKADEYDFIYNKDEIRRRFSSRFGDRNNWFWSIYGEKENKYPKIDGKLYRVVRFIVRLGYDFPNINSLFDDNVRDIEFIKANEKNKILLNKEYARKMSDTLLFLLYFLKKMNLSVINPAKLFDKNYKDIIIGDSNRRKSSISLSNLDHNISDYFSGYCMLKNHGFIIEDIDSLFNKQRKIELEYNAFESKSVGDTMTINHKGYNITISREKMVTMSNEALKLVGKAFNLGFSFPDGDNAFDVSNPNIKVRDLNGIEYVVCREQFDNMLDIIRKCKDNGFKVNLSQLFDLNQETIEVVYSDDRKAKIKKNLTIQMMGIFDILMKNGYTPLSFDNLFDEKQLYISVSDEKRQERPISRKQIRKIVELNDLAKIYSISREIKEKLSANDLDLLFMLNNSTIKKKLFKWLPYTAKKWLPSSAIISKIPPERSNEYFNNNNHARLQILKDHYKPKNYEEMEGIVSLSYILGLFDSKGSTSIKALYFIINYFYKRGVSASKLHTNYGAVDLSKGFNRNFADFFMKHYSLNSEAFIDLDLGIDKAADLFNRFDIVLELRPEKKIKTNTNNERLTPNDAMAAIASINIDKSILGDKINDERYVELLMLLTKFGADEYELKWAINLYEQALALDESKVLIPNVNDLSSSLMSFNSILKADPHIFLSGKKTNCCSKFRGLAQDRLEHTITDLCWRYVTFTSPNRTFFDGLVWYDQQTAVVCIDNIEGRFSSIDKNKEESIPLMTDTIIRYADAVYIYMNKHNIPCRKVNVGKDTGTPSWNMLRYALKHNLMIEDENPCNYPRINGISSDSHEQLIITNERLLRQRSK